MKSSAKNIQLTPLDDLFKIDAERKDDTLERVRQIPIVQLFPFKNHPFQVRDDESMKSSVESVKLVGVLSPAITSRYGSRTGPIRRWQLFRRRGRPPECWAGTRPVPFRFKARCQTTGMSKRIRDRKRAACN